MAVLGWTKGADQAVIPFQTNVRVGSQIRVRGRHYASGHTPESFQVFRGYGSLARKYREWKGRPAETLLADLQLDAAQSTSTVAISEPFIVPQPRRRLRVPLFAQDSVATRTNPNPIFATRLGGINVGPTINVLGNGGSLGSAQVTAAVDPDLDLHVLLPWQSDHDETVQDVIRDIASDLASEKAEFYEYEEYESATAWLLEDVAWALPTEPLPGWSIQISHRTMSLAEGQTSAISIVFITPTPGAAAFAIRARGAVPDGEIEEVASEIFALEVEPNLEQVSLTLL